MKKWIFGLVLGAVLGVSAEAQAMRCYDIKYENSTRLGDAITYAGIFWNLPDQLCMIEKPGNGRVWRFTKDGRVVTILKTLIKPDKKVDCGPDCVKLQYQVALIDRVNEFESVIERYRPHNSHMYMRFEGSVDPETGVERGNFFLNRDRFSYYRSPEWESHYQGKDVAAADGAEPVQEWLQASDDSWVDSDERALVEEDSTVPASKRAEPRDQINRLLISPNYCEWLLRSEPVLLIKPNPADFEKWTQKRRKRQG